MKSANYKNISEEEDAVKSKVTVSDIMCNLARKNSIGLINIEILPQTIHKVSDNLKSSKNCIINDDYVKMNDDDKDEKEDEEDLFLLAGKDRTKFLSKIREIINNSQMNSKVKDIFFISKECKVSFNYFLFLKFLFYHLTYFFFLGPLSLLFLLPIEGYNFVCNMNFIGLNYNHLQSLLMFLGGAPNIMICIYFNSSYNINEHVFEISELIFCCLAIFIRCIIIGVRYATTTSCFIQLRYDGILPQEIKKREYILLSSRKFDPKIIDAEIYESMIRNQIDIEFFVFTCLNHITDEYLIRFNDELFFDKYGEKISTKNIENQHTLVFENRDRTSIELFNKGLHISNEVMKKNPHIEFYKILSQINKVDEDHLPNYLKNAPFDILNLYFSGRLFFRELVLHSEKFVETRISKLIFLLIIIRSLMPIFFRVYNDTRILGNSLLENYIIILNLFISWITYSFNVAFVEIADKDLNTRYLLMQYLSSLINPDKMSLDSELLRNIPLINIFCPKNLTTWLNFRVLTLDIGKRYFYRLQIYASAFIFCYMLLTFSFVLGYFKVIQLNFEKSPLLILIGGSELLIFSIIVFRYIYLGALINKYAKIHINQLFILKENINLIIQIFPKFRNMKNFASMILEKAKFVYDYLIKYKSFNDDQNVKIDDDFFIKNLEEVNSCIEKTIEKIEFEENNNPLKILDTELNFKLIYRIYGVVITIVYSLIQVKISNLFMKNN